MNRYSFQPRGVCSKQMDFSIEGGKLHDVKITGGCPGNTLALSKLLENRDAEEIVSLLKGNPCGNRGTSCMDQLAIAVEKALANPSTETVL